MKRFILTGAPGVGKTTLLHYLSGAGYAVVEEAATDVIAREQENGVPEPWADPAFIDAILALQSERQEQPVRLPSAIQFFDRGPLDTLALCRYLGYPESAALLEIVRQVLEAGRYEPNVFFIENLGYCEPSAARKITFEQSLEFERVHEVVYREWGYRCIPVPRLPVAERAAIVLDYLAGAT